MAQNRSPSRVWSTQEAPKWSEARSVDVMHHRLLVPGRQCHAALGDVAHELALPVRCAHAQASLGSHETLSVVDISICSATPRRLRYFRLVPVLLIKVLEEGWSIPC